MLGPVSLLLSLASPAAGHLPAARAPSTVVSERQAHALAASTLSSRVRRFPRRDYEGVARPELADRFHAFQIVADPCPDCSPVLGTFAVNRATGDVWDLSACTRRTSPAVRAAQGRARRRLPAATFRRLSALAPCQP